MLLQAMRQEPKGRPAQRGTRLHGIAVAARQKKVNAAIERAFARMSLEEFVLERALAGLECSLFVLHPASAETLRELGFAAKHAQKSDLGCERSHRPCAAAPSRDLQPHRQIT
jgi:hypothetical protein